MARASSGFRKGSRKKLRKSLRLKFKPQDRLVVFKPKTKVVIKQNPQSQKGMPHPVFKGRTGTVVSKRGSAYILEVRIGNAKKQIIARPEHLKEISKTKYLNKKTKEEI